jgi:hypothetical protein
MNLQPNKTQNQMNLQPNETQSQTNLQPSMAPGQMSLQRNETPGQTSLQPNETPSSQLLTEHFSVGPAAFNHLMCNSEPLRNELEKLKHCNTLLVKSHEQKVCLFTLIYICLLYGRLHVLIVILLVSLCTTTVDRNYYFKQNTIKKWRS